MNNTALAQAVQEAAKPKFRGQQKRNSVVQMHRPENMAREYMRVTDAYMKILHQVVSAHMPKIKRAAALEKRARLDDAQDLSAAVRDAFAAMNMDLEQRTGSFALERRLDNLANLTRKLTVNEWKRVVKSTLGISLLDDYYLGEFYREQLRKWTVENVDLIKSIPKNTLSEMQNIVSDGFKTGKTVTTIAREIQDTYGMEKRHARFLARDQIAKLNSDITKHQQQDAGVEEYVWSTSGDSRVRDRHASLNGKTFKWSDPPIVSEPGKPERRCHPGEDYQCRCVALPKFNINTLNLPMAQG